MTTRLLIIVLAAGLGAVDARGIVRVFFTSSAQPYGLTNPALALQPTLGQQQDAASYQVAAFPPLESWGQTPTINWHIGEFAYIWVRFHQETNNRKIQGVIIDLDEFPSEVAYYVMDDLNGDNDAKRWDGAYTMPNAPEFKMDPQIMAAVQNAGITNRSSTVDNWNLYDNVTRTALLAAVRYSSDGLRGVYVQSSPPSPIPPPPWVIQWDGGQANWIPEPATLGLMLVLCAAGQRSRRAGFAL